MSILNLFPARIRFVNPDGTLTPEAARMFEVLMNRVGGMVGDGGVDVFAPVPADSPDHASVMQPVPETAIAPDLMQAPHGEALPEMVMQSANYTAGTGLKLTGQEFALKDTAVIPAIYGDAATVGKFNVDQQGRLIYAEAVPILIANTQVTGLGTMSTQNIGTNFTGSFTGTTVTVSNGIITSVV